MVKTRDRLSLRNGCIFKLEHIFFSGQHIAWRRTSQASWLWQRGKKNISVLKNAAPCKSKWWVECSLPCENLFKHSGGYQRRTLQEILAGGGWRSRLPTYCLKFHAICCLIFSLYRCFHGWKLLLHSYSAIMQRLLEVIGGGLFPVHHWWEWWCYVQGSA
jgi:hypothetical protein